VIEASQGWESAEYRDGGRFEELGGYVRAKRVGPFVYIAGTTAVERSGRVHQPGDTEAQTRFTLQRIDAALRAVGSSLHDVVRTRAYLVDMADAARSREPTGKHWEMSPRCSPSSARSWPRPG
jgi:enamine deaminase RidA (YjgF/YER057c/UK114 family)